MRTNCLVLIAIMIGMLWGNPAFAGHPETPVNLGAAGNFVILTKSGISAKSICAVTGNMGVSPIDSTGITGFTLMLPAASPFSTSAQVTGKIYAPDYAAPTPAFLTTAIGDMETAYAAAKARSLPDTTESGVNGGDISGLTIEPGLHKWATSVSINTASDVTLAGGPTDVWIFQIAGDLTLNPGAKVLLSGGAQAQNIFWQVAGGAGALLDTNSQMEGIILSKTTVIMKSDAACNGRLYAQTAVTLDHNQVVNPLTNPSGTPLTIAIYVLDGDRAMLELVTTAGQTYGVEYRNSLLEGSWLDGSGPLDAIANRTEWFDPDPLIQKRYYRAVETTP